jgi:hypothetical protein
MKFCVGQHTGYAYSLTMYSKSCAEDIICPSRGQVRISDGRHGYEYHDS